MAVPSARRWDGRERRGAQGQRPPPQGIGAGLSECVLRRHWGGHVNRVGWIGRGREERRVTGDGGL